MSLSRDQKILIAMYVSEDSSGESEARPGIIEDFLSFVAFLDANTQAALRSELDHYNAPRLQRALSRYQRSGEVIQKSFEVEMDSEGNWLRDGEVIGKRWLLYKAVQPYEAQSRVAYDVFYQTMFAILSRRHRVALLQETQYFVELFVPTNTNLGFGALWDALVAEVFSEQNLTQTFVGLMRSVKLADRGFSAIDMPILTEEQARILAGFDLINLRSLLTGDESRRREIAVMERRLDDPDLDDGERKKTQKQTDDLRKKLQARVDRYDPMYSHWIQIQQETPTWAASVCSAEKRFDSSARQPLAGQQLMKRADVMRLAVQQISDLSRLVTDEEFFILEPLLSPKPIPASVLSGGDSSTKICYGCGRVMVKGDRSYQANTFIFAAPSQRLQSGGSQKQPNVCGTCAAVAFVSPIKLGEGRLVLRLKRVRDDDYSFMPDEQLKMFALGDLNIVAGRYAMLQTPEKIGNKLVIDKLGAVQYALYKVASIFSSPTVFREYVPEVMIGETMVLLPVRQVIWMQQLIAIFYLNRSWHDKALFSAFGRAIRYVQHDNVIYAIYELLRTGFISGQRISFAQAVQLEELRESHWEELMKGSKQAQFYQDVAAMTGLHFAFCAYIQSSVKSEEGSTPNKVRIEVNKAIDRVANPFDFNYTEAGNTKKDSATLFYQPSIYFTYECTEALLRELNVNIDERVTESSERGKRMRLYVDDVINAHTYLVENRYTSEKAQREFFYALKLSLHTRFPELIKSNKENE